MESKGYQVKLVYINQVKTAKLAHQDSLLAQKAERREQAKEEAEGAEQQALDQYRITEQNNLSQKQETEK